METSDTDYLIYVQLCAVLRKPRSIIYDLINECVLSFFYRGRASQK